MIVAFFTAAANALASSMSISPASFRRAFNSSPPNVALVALGEAVDEFVLGGEERSAPAGTPGQFFHHPDRHSDKTAVK